MMQSISTTNCIFYNNHRSIGRGPDGTIILFGDKCNEKDEAAIARDAEFIDFFDNAPIALHWLSGEGIVLWANKTEMR